MIVEYTGNQVAMLPICYKNLKLKCMVFRGCQVYFLILACEPLHDIENHIKNLFEELPHHMADKKKGY